MTKARNIADLVDANGDIVSSALDNVPASNDASALTTGTIDNARISLDANEIPNLDTSKITSGQFADARISDLDVTKLTGTITPSDNTVSLAKLTATGTKDATTFLRGDNSFQEVPAGGITEADTWRFTNSLTTEGDLTTYWERND